MANDTAIAREFIRVLRSVDPTGEITAIYRQNSMLDQLYKASLATATTGNPKYVRRARKKYTGVKT